MSDFRATKNEEELDLLETVDGAVSFDIELDSADRGSGFHTKNQSQTHYHRDTVVQRKGAVYIKCTCVDVIHGRWGTSDPNAAATLLVLSFRFDSRKRDRRVSEANLEFIFFDSKGRNRNNPQVARISLDGNFSLAPSHRTETTTVGTEGSLGGGILSTEVSGNVKWERQIEEETTGAISVVGSIDLLGAPAGPSNAASWTVLENPQIQKGVPAAMRVGVLLKRWTEEDFYCTVKVETKVDLKTRIEQSFGGREADDPILFSTQKAPTHNLMRYDSGSLGDIDLSIVEDVTVTTVRSGAIKYM